MASLVAEMIAGADSVDDMALLRHGAMGKLFVRPYAPSTLGSFTLTGGRLATATTATIRRTLISVPARIACSARRLTLHLPVAWPWETAWTQLFTHTCGPPPPAAA